MSSYLQVAEEEGEEPIELPTEDDGTLLLSTLSAQFPGSCGLKYRLAESRGFRGVRLVEGRFHPPEDGWGKNLFSCVFPKENKRKSDDTLENSTAKTKRMEPKAKCTDLIILGLPWKATEQQLREHFETFGEVLMVQIKRYPRTGQSKGFGFIRFATPEAQIRVIAQRHLIDGRWCDVRIPNSKEGQSHMMPGKIFVGRCTEEISADDLREYFSKFGEVTDVFVPKPFRAFAFVTFLDNEVARALCGEDHIIKQVSVHVSEASPKQDTARVRKIGQIAYGGRGEREDKGYGEEEMNGSGFHGGGRGPFGGGGRYGGGGEPGPRRRFNIDMPNLQALGITGQNNGGGSGSGKSWVDMAAQELTSQASTLGMSLLPFNPSLVAAALNHSWGILANLQGGSGGGSGAPSGPGPSSGPPPSGNFHNWGDSGGPPSGGGWQGRHSKSDQNY